MYANPVIGLSGDNFAEADLTNAKLDSIQLLIGFPTDVVESSGGKERFDFHKIFPIVAGQWSGPGDPIPSIKSGGSYYIYTVRTGQDFQFTGDFDTKQFWDFIIQLRNLNGARNLDQARIAKGLRDFMNNNKALISPSLGKPRC